MDINVIQALCYFIIFTTFFLTSFRLFLFVCLFVCLSAKISHSCDEIFDHFRLSNRLQILHADLFLMTMPVCKIWRRLDKRKWWKICEFHDDTFEFQATVTPNVNRKFSVNKTTCEIIKTQSKIKYINIFFNNHVFMWA